HRDFYQAMDKRTVPVIDQEYADIQRNTPGPVKMLALSHGRYAKDIDEFRTNK
ncbi:12110_t:CDS:2, partial [Entrophospora sp. SA101]